MALNTLSVAISYHCTLKRQACIGLHTHHMAPRTQSKVANLRIT